MYTTKNKWCHLYLQIACCFDKLEWLINPVINYDDVKISYLIEVAVTCGNDKILEYLFEKYDTNNKNHHVDCVSWYVNAFRPEHELCMYILEKHNFYVHYEEVNCFLSIMIEDMTFKENMERCFECHSTNVPCDCYIDNQADDYY